MSAPFLEADQGLTAKRLAILGNVAVLTGLEPRPSPVQARDQRPDKRLLWPLSYRTGRQPATFTIVGMPLRSMRCFSCSHSASSGG